MLFDEVKNNPGVVIIAMLFGLYFYSFAWFLKCTVLVGIALLLSVILNELSLGNINIPVYKLFTNQNWMWLSMAVLLKLTQWIYLDDGLIIAALSAICIFMVLISGFVDIHELYDFKPLTNVLHQASVIVTAAVGAIAIYVIFFTSIITGVFLSKLFLLALICLCVYCLHIPLIQGKETSGGVFVLYLLVFRTFFYDVTLVPSGSMTFTLQIAEFILIKKCEYGFSQASLWPIGSKLRILPTYKRRSVKRNEIISWSKDCGWWMSAMVKRVIAVGGQRFRVEDKVLVIDGQRSDWEYIGLESRVLDDNRQLNVGRYKETDFDGNTRTIITGNDGIYGEDRYATTDDVTVPEGYFAVIGDNRVAYGSSDSRGQSVTKGDIGNIPEEQLIGGVKYRLISSTSWQHTGRYSEGLLGWVEFVVASPKTIYLYIKYIEWDRCMTKVQ